MTKQEVKYMLEQCADNLSRLSPWERQRVEEWTDLLENGGDLSDRQAEIVEEMYQKVP